MSAVWSAEQAVSAREVCERFKGDKARAYTTIMTTLDRLHRKGLLVREKDGLAWRYAAAISRENFERALADALATKLIRRHGDAGLAAFVDATAQLSEKGLDRLADLITARKRGGQR